MRFTTCDYSRVASEVKKFSLIFLLHPVVQPCAVPNRAVGRDGLVNETLTGATGLRKTILPAPVGRGVCRVPSSS
jgi:hypothetical protein